MIKHDFLKALFVSFFLGLTLAESPAAAGDENVCKEACQQMSQYFSEQKYEEALAVSVQALEETPGSFKVYKMLAQIHWHRQEWDAMYESAERALAVNHEDWELLALSGRASFMKSNYVLAAETLEKSFAIEREVNGGRPELCFDLAATYLKLEDYVKAVEWAQEAVSLAPDFATAHYMLGRILFESEKFAESIPGFLKALELKPALAGVGEYLGMAYVKIGDIEKAKQIFQEVLKSDPANKIAREQLALIAK